MVYPVKKVVKRDGRIVDFDSSRIKNAIKKAMISVGMYDEKNLKKVTNYVLRVLADKYGTERIPHVEEIQDIVEFALMKYDLYEVAKAYILYRKEREKIRKEKMLLLNKDYLDEVDKSFSLNSIRLLASRYLLKDEKGNVIESPKQMFQRVAMLVVIPDILYDSIIYDKDGEQEKHPKETFNPSDYDGKIGFTLKDGSRVTWNRYHLERMRKLYDELNINNKMKMPWSRFFKLLQEGYFNKYSERFMEYYNLMVEKKFMPNSPTLFNAGTRLGQLSACFVLGMDDSIESIMDAAKEAAIIFKSGGGIGINYSKLRPEGDIVFSTSGVASGPVSFMKIIDVVTDVIKQGGRRRGANMGILEIWHPDIEKFITSKTTPGNLENFNISVMIDGDFWNYLNENREYPLTNPRNKEVWKKINSRHLFHLIAEMAWRTGDPGLLFVDHINRKNILREALGEIRTTNPCVSGDTRILTPHGWIKAEEIFRKASNSGFVRGVEVDDGLLGEGGDKHAYKTQAVTVVDNEIIFKTNHENTLKLSIPKVVDTWVWHLGKKDGLKINTKEGYEIIVTPEHKFLTQDGWKEANKLKKGDKIQLSRIHPSFLDNIDIGEYDLDHDVAFSLGWLIGDGTFNRNYVAWFFSDDDKTAEEIVRRGIEKIGGNPLSHTYVMNKNEYKIQYDKGSKVYKKILKLIGNYIEDGGEKTLPEIIWRLKIPSLISFLRGLFTANGYVDEDIGIRLTSVSIEILKEIQILLTTLGIVSRIYERPYKRKFTYITKEGRKKRYESNGYYELVISGYSRKIFKEIIGFENINKIEKLSLNKTKEDTLWTTISSVETVKNVDFYDFTVPKYHNYIGNGILNHNCGEEPLYPYESCNLGSINLYAFIEFSEDGKAYFNWDEYHKTIRIALRFLDNIIDVNKFPIRKIENTTKKSRKVGLGLMGLADTLYALKIPYNSEDGFNLMKKIAEHLTYYAMDESVNLAIERGVFPIYNSSEYVKGEMPIDGYYTLEEWTLDWNRLRDRILKHGIRNAEVTTIAPTGSISMIADTSSGIEPQFALVYEKRVTVGTFFYVDAELERQLKERGLYEESILKKISDNGGSIQGLDEIPEDMKKIFVVAYDIPWWDHIRAQKEISKWICAAVSKTINMPNWVTIEDVEKAYLFAYKLGVKGITIYRDGSKGAQVLVTPSQRRGRYVVSIENNTLKIMEELGIEPPKPHPEAVLAKNMIEVVKEIKPSPHAAQQTVEVKRIMRCPECGSERLIFIEDCIRCLDCGWSTCTV